MAMVVPASDTIPMNIEVNLPTTKFSFSAGNVVFFQPSEVGLPNSSTPIACDNLNMNASIRDSTLSGKFGAGNSHFASFSGELATNGHSIAKGTYSGAFCSNPPLSVQGEGTLTGSTVAPVNGTFTGTLNSNLHGPDVVTITITQNPDFSLNFSGTSVENGVTSNLIASTNPGDSLVTGAIVYLGGSSMNVNGSQDFSFSAHLNTGFLDCIVGI